MSNATATSKQKAAAPKAAPKETKPKARPFLTGAQERIVDAIGELLIFGGTRRNLDALCRIAADHEARRINRPLFDKGDEIKMEQHVADRVRAFAPRWFDELAAARANREKLPAENQPEPKTVTEMVRANVRNDLASSWRNFLANGNPEELALMARVLTWWASCHSGWGNGYEEVYLASAFQGEIGQADQYVRVPYHLKSEVEDYLRVMLIAKPVKEAA